MGTFCINGKSCKLPFNTYIQYNWGGKTQINLTGTDKEAMAEADQVLIERLPEVVKPKRITGVSLWLDEHQLTIGTVMPAPPQGRAGDPRPQSGETSIDQIAVGLNNKKVNINGTVME